MAANPGHPVRTRGFTLIEVIVMIIIIMVLSSVAVPTYARFRQRVQFQQSVQSVVALLASARDTALRSGQDVDVRLDAQTETFTVDVPAPEDIGDLPAALQENQPSAALAAPAPYAMDPETAIVDVVRYGAQSTAAVPTDARAAATLVQFHEDGSADGARFTLASMRGYQATVEVLSTSGQAAVSDDSTTGQ
jgi:type II secretory pathway pseudopilin PulG